MKLTIATTGENFEWTGLECRTHHPITHAILYRVSSNPDETIKSFIDRHINGWNEKMDNEPELKKEIDECGRK